MLEKVVTKSARWACRWTLSQQWKCGEPSGTYFVLGFPPFLRPPLLLLPFLLPLPFQSPVRLFLIRVAVVLLTLLFPTPLLSPWGILGLLSPIIFQFTFFQLTILPANQPPKHCELRNGRGPFESSKLVSK